MRQNSIERCVSTWYFLSKERVTSFENFNELLNYPNILTAWFERIRFIFYLFFFLSLFFFFFFFFITSAWLKFFDFSKKRHDTQVTEIFLARSDTKFTEENVAPCFYITRSFYHVFINFTHVYPHARTRAWTVVARRG